MTSPTVRAYTSDVYALGPSLGCAIVAVAIAVGAMVAVRTPLPALLAAAADVAVVVAGFVVLTAHVRVAVTAGSVAYRVGLGGWRRFDRAAMRDAECLRLDARAIVGIGIPFTTATARHVVRSGSVLHLNTRAGEHIWLSIREPVPADLLPAGARGETSMNGERRPWFGSKRIGWGIRPQTWQGWLVTLGFIALFVLVISVVVPLIAAGH